MSNVQKVWEDVQKHLTGEYEISENIRETLDNLIAKHDKSKFLNDEFPGYCAKFFPEPGKEPDEKEFLMAWNHHQKTNPHHWEFWLMWYKKETTALPMPLPFLIEMLCDWTAMSHKFKNKPSDWFAKNEKDMFLHEKTRTGLKHWIKVFDKVYE